MSKEVVLRKSGNGLVFTVPTNFNVKVGTKYSVLQKDDGSVIYTPIKHTNVFSTPEFKNHDFQADVRADPDALGEVKPAGKEWTN